MQDHWSFPYPIRFMGLVYLPTFTIKLTQMQVLSNKPVKMDPMGMYMYKKEATVATLRLSVATLARLIHGSHSPCATEKRCQVKASKVGTLR